MNAFTFFDVETPNQANDSICSIGIVRVNEAGEIETQDHHLINPERGFDPYNTKLTGISRADVQGSPTFPELWESDLSTKFQDSLVVAHNVPFDLSVLAKTLRFYDISLPEIHCDCTMRLSRHYLPNLRDYRLPTICNELGVRLDQHHNALSDAIACMSVFGELDNRYGVREVCGYAFTDMFSRSSINKHALARAMTDLYGITLGVSIDGVINKLELSAYESWLERNYQEKEQKFFHECYSFVQKVLSDGVIEDHERDALLNLSRPFVQGTGLSSSETAATQELLGVIRGINADKTINEREAINLKYWMEDNEHLQQSKSFSRIYSSLDQILKDGILTEKEEKELLILFDKILNPIEESSSSCVFPNRSFCLTGDFERGSKQDIEKYIVSQGGNCVKNVTKKCDYVVVGCLGSKDYAFGNYGTKVKKAMEYKESGLPIQIVQETLLFQ